VAVLVGLVAVGLQWPKVRAVAVATLAKWTDSDHDEHAGHNHAAGDCDHDDGDPDHEAEADHDHKDGAHEHGDHDHKYTDHKHVETEAVKLSQNAQTNVGLRLGKVELQPFVRTMTVPGMVIERPGRSELQVSAPLTGVVTRIWAIQGESVAPGQPLFDLRLTHEEVVEAQAEFLRTAEEMDVLGREIARLERVAADGAIAGKTLLERKYEQQKLEGIWRAQRQRLLLHGLSAAQVESIASTRTLLSEFTVNAPSASDEPSDAGAERRLQVEELKVLKGQHIKVGDPLCVLADHARLYIQGKAFEQDAVALDRATGNNWPLTAVVEATAQDRTLVKNLSIVYLANKVEPDSRALLFYVELPNQVLRRRETPDHRQFSTWQFRPGQRVDLQVPIERWEKRIVLPLAAVVQDGAESYVFEQNAGHFDRRSVCVEYRDQYSVVVANDGTLTPGKEVVVSGAYQIHLAMKNKSGGAPDPHAGHNH
jgi:multidrug efflux pump subunit AcrA (membrane-fusion protein)